MRVICINTSSITPGAGRKFINQLSEGTIYTVIREVFDTHYKCEGYVLEEVKSDRPHQGFRKSRFALLSNIDETELLEQRKSELV